MKQKAERDLQRIRPLYEQNAASQLDLDNAVAAFEAAQAEVIMSEADPKVDPNTGTFSVRAQMPNPDYILLPGQLTKVRLLMDVHENAIVVPKKALVIEKGGAYVFVVRKDLIVEKRFVELGPEVENRVVVERGLGVDEMIIVEGFHKLSHGMRVNYEYMVSNQITPFVKYNMFHAEMKRKRRKNAFLIENMFYNKELDFYICPMGQHLEFVKQIKEKSDLGYESTKSVYRAKDCSRCPLR